MNRSKASKHYRNLIDAYGTLDERREEQAWRPIGFTAPRSVEARGPSPTGVETQTWEGWYEGE